MDKKMEFEKMIVDILENCNMVWTAADGTAFHFNSKGGFAIRQGELIGSWEMDRQVKIKNGNTDLTADQISEIQNRIEEEK